MFLNSTNWRRKDQIFSFKILTELHGYNLVIGHKLLPHQKTTKTTNKQKHVAGSNSNVKMPDGKVHAFDNVII